MKKWSEEEIQYLRDNYPNNKNIILVNYLNRNQWSIATKANKLKIYKSKKRRILDYETLKNIALKYQTKSDFQKNDLSAYSTARKLGILDEICTHMFNHKHSTPQLILFEILKIIIPNTEILYNTRKIIKPYELDIYFPEYNLAFEYNGKYWHKNNKYDNLKINLCKEKNIELIVINEKTTKYINDIKNDVVSNLDKINLVTKLNISEKQILDINENVLSNLIKDKIIDIKHIKDIIEKYNNFSEFIQKEPKIYLLLYNRNLLNEYTSDLVRDRKYWTIDTVKEVVSKYKNYSDFTKENNQCYQYIVKNNLLYLLSDLKKDKLSWNFDKIKELIINNNYTKINDIRNNYVGAYTFIHKNKLAEKYKKFIKENNLKTQEKELVL